MPPQLSDEDLESDDGPDTVPAKALPPASKVEDVKPEDDGEDEDESDGEDEYKVESILKHKEQAGRIVYLIKWEGYEKVSDQTWEPIENLTNATELLDEYHDQLGGQPEPKSAKKKGPKPKRPASEAFSSSGANGSASKRTRKSEANGDFTLPEGSWEDHIVRINSILEETEAKDEDKTVKEARLIALVEWGQGNKTQHHMPVLRRKAPQKLLDYYEAHLVFKGN